MLDEIRKELKAVKAYPVKDACVGSQTYIRHIEYLLGLLEKRSKNTRGGSATQMK